jgi:hypothetical protein
MTLKVFVHDSYITGSLFCIPSKPIWDSGIRFTPHFTKKPIYVFPEMKLCGLVPNSYVYVSVSDLPRIGLQV